MTKEEAIKWLKSIYCRFNPTGEILENEGGDVHLQALKMAIEALSAVCDDCIWNVCNYNKIDWNGEDGYISRRDAINTIENTDAEITAEEWDELTNAIKSLPSAEPKTGKWIKVIDEETPNVVKWHYECDQCGAGRWEKGQRYCQSCGARMEDGDE